MSETGLFVVATPIGNLEDISARALRVLAAVDCIAAEDTRHTRKLLQHHGITTRLRAMHEHNEQQSLPALLELLEDGGSLALVSDAGTPLISDPGYRLVCAAREKGLPVWAVPGPSALTAALSVAGLPTDRFIFDGFLPARAAARRQRLEALAGERRTLVFFESGHRIRAAVKDMRVAFGPGRLAAICRELTKQFETVLRGDLESLDDRLQADPDQRRGEFVVLVAGNREAAAPHAQGLELAKALLDYLPASQAARAAARITGAPRRELFAALGEK